MTVAVLRGDARCLPLADGSVDAVVCDPPYGLEFMGQDWDSFRGEAWRAGAGMSKPGLGDRPTACSPAADRRQQIEPYSSRVEAVWPADYANWLLSLRSLCTCLPTR